MITTVSIDTEEARKALIISAGSAEEAKLYQNYTDEEIKDKVLQHCKCWAITECKSEENKPKKISHWVKHNTPNGLYYYSCYSCGCGAPYTETIDSWLWKLSNFCPDCGARMEKFYGSDNI